jgi:sugar/nucleoside kinase (ribokinase family)
MLGPALDSYATGIVSKVGEDFEQEYWNTLKSSGLDLTGFHRIGTRSTRFVNKYDSKGNRMQMVEALAEQITEQDFPSAYNNAKVVHFSPLTANEIDVECFRHARAHAKLTSIDVQGYVRSIDDKGMVIPRDWTERNEILNLVDVVKFHELELKQAIIGESELSAVSEVLSLGPRIVLVTRDRRGSTIYTRKEQITIPRVNSDNVIDSTGCGDVYSIGFLLEYIQSSDLKQSGLFAATCSSFNLETSGPYSFPSQVDIRRRMKDYRE